MAYGQPQPPALRLSRLDFTRRIRYNDTAGHQNNYNPRIPVFLKTRSEVMGLENEDIHGFSVD